MTNLDSPSERPWEKCYPLSVRLLRNGFPFSNILLGAGLYAAGFTIAAMKEQIYEFLEVWYIYVAIIGIVWVTGVYCWFFPIFSEALKSAENEFLDITPKRYESIVLQAIKPICDVKDTLLFSVFPAIALTVLWVSLLYYRILPMFLNVKYDIIFSPHYEYAIWGSILGVLCVGLVLNSIRYFRILMRLLVHLFKLPLKLEPFYHLKDHGNERIIRVVLSGIYTYFFGVSLIAAVAFTFTNFITIGLLALTTGVGVVGFFYPQVLYRRAVSEAKLRVSKEIVKGFSERYGSPVKWNEFRIESLVLFALLEEMNRIKEWPMDVLGTAKFVVAALVPSLMTLVRTYFGL